MIEPFAPVEQAEVTFEVSVAVAQNVVVESFSTVTVMPVEEKVSALPLPTGDPLQSEFV